MWKMLFWEIEQRSIDIAPNYKDWVELGFALVDGLGENGREYYHRISRFYLHYQREEDGPTIHALPALQRARHYYSFFLPFGKPSRNLHWLRSVKNIYPFFQISKMVKRVNG